MNRKKVTLLSVIHFSTDIHSSALPAVLPYLRDSLSLSYQATGGIMFANSLLGAVLQPFFGLALDRFRTPWIIPLATILAGAGLAMAGLAASYFGVIAAVAVSGLGIALFHPPAARLASRLGGQQKGLAMSLFSIGGSAGYAMGPPAAVLCASLLGLGGITLFGLFAAVMVAAVAVLGLFRDEQTSVRGAERAAAQAPLGENNWKQFGCIALIITVRAAVLVGCMTYLPLHLIQAFAMDKAAGAMAVTVLGVCGIASNILGGWLSDRKGASLALKLAHLPMPLALLVLAASDSAWAVWAMAPVLGFCTHFAYGPTIVLGQQFLARNVAFASGVVMGLATAMGGLCSPALGWAGDIWGLEASFVIMACMALAAALAVFFVDPSVNAEKPADRAAEKQIGEAGKA